LRRPPQNGNYQLAEMKTHGGRSVKIQINVMNQMKPPEERNFVRQNVPQIKRVVEQNYR
jgi:hypothetical protein